MVGTPVEVDKDENLAVMFLFINAWVQDILKFLVKM
jgi:hypothetical protein